MALTKLGFFGEVKWDFLIYLARIYKNLGFKVGLLDASLEKNLEYFLPKDLAMEVIDYDDEVHFVVELKSSVDLKDIGINISGDQLSINNTKMQIPCDIKRKEKPKIRCKNGILELIFKKK